MHSRRGSTWDPKVAPAGTLLTATDLAERWWQVPTSWVYDAARRGHLPAVRLGRYRRFRIEAIEQFEAQGGTAG
jgi:excisionase family DNA binding protein